MPADNPVRALRIRPGRAGSRHGVEASAHQAHRRLEKTRSPMSRNATVVPATPKLGTSTTTPHRERVSIR